jgi:1-acyl-sn-glycerol-3-phosphate acyltransferase
LSQSSIEETPRRNGLRPYPRTLPPWALKACRRVIRVISRLLWRVRWTNTEYIPETGGLIIAGNHQTYLDPFWIACIIDRPVRFLAWDAAFSWPLVGRFMGLFGAWPLPLEGTDPAPIRRSLQWVREGNAVEIFPEGGRGHSDGSMRKFKAGAVRMAMEAGVPILPVTVRGGERIWPMSYKFPRLMYRVEIVYHPLFTVEQRENEGLRECARRETERLAEIVKSAL